MLIPRFEVEPEYELEKRCRCLSCYERTGNWLVKDTKDEHLDEVFDSEEEANKRCEELNNVNESNS